MAAVGRWNSVKGENVSLDTSGFSGSLSSADYNVQLAIATLDGAGGGGGSLDTTNFDGLLSATEDTIQKAMDVLDTPISLFQGGVAKVTATAGGANIGSLSLTGTSIESATGIDLKVSGNENGIIIAQDGAVTIYYDDSLKFSTIANGISISDGTNGPFVIAYSDDDIYLQNQDADGEFYLSARQSGGSYKDLFHGDPDGASEMYHDGLVAIATFTDGLYIYDGGVQEMFIGDVSGVSEVYSYIHGQPIGIRAEDDSGNQRYALLSDPDGTTSIYNPNTNVAVLVTTDTGISITDGTATAATIGFTDDDLYISNNDADGEVYIQAERTASGQSVLFHGDPDGAASLYHNNSVRLITTAGGIQLDGGSDVLTISDIGSGNWRMNAGNNRNIEITEGTLFMARFVNAGAVELYYSTVKKFETTATGISITDGTATAATISFSADDLLISNNDADGNVFIYGRTSANDDDHKLFYGDPDGRVTIYYNDLDVLTTESTGVKVQNAGGAGDDHLKIRGTGSAWILESELHGAVLQLQGEQTAGGAATFFEGDPDAGVSLYWSPTATKILSTTVSGISITDGTATAATIGFITDDLYIINNDANGNTQFQNRNNADDQTNTSLLLTDTYVQFYYTNVAQVQTMSGGLSFNLAGTSDTNMYKSGNNFIIENRQDAGQIQLTADATGGANKFLFTGDPDGAATLYWNGSAKIATATGGVTVTGDVGATSMDTTAANEWTKSQNFDETTLTSTSNAVAWDAESNQCALHTLTENTTIGAPSNLKAGATYILRVVQAAGVYSLAFNAVFKWGTASAPTAPAANGDVIILSFYSDGTNMYGIEAVREEA